MSLLSTVMPDILSPFLVVKHNSSYLKLSCLVCFLYLVPRNFDRISYCLEIFFNIDMTNSRSLPVLSKLL